MLSYTNCLALTGFAIFLSLPPHFSSSSDFLIYHYFCFVFCKLSLSLSCSTVPNSIMITTMVVFCIVVFDLSLPSVHAAGAKVKDLEDEADRLLEKLQPIKKLQDNLRRNISQIKELINQARKQANSVSC